MDDCSHRQLHYYMMRKTLATKLSDLVMTTACLLGPGALLDATVSLFFGGPEFQNPGLSLTLLLEQGSVGDCTRHHPMSSFEVTGRRGELVSWHINR